ncbi:hypothetical protein INTERNEXUS_93 [Bacillus phage vB_BspM_Internexus]|nr:hypothetical protein INTERNEXUS_93 [Bacillus phage vB_BspM_Internexus]
MAEENSIITVNNTSYSIEDKWLEIAKKYFGIDDNDEVSISLLKAGLFGYNNEVMSNEIKNNIYHRNILYDEHFLNTASIPKSIYNFAKVQNSQISMATPSHMKINFSVKKSDVINSTKFRKIDSDENLSDSDSAYEFIINNDYLLSVGDYNFMIPFPIQLIFKANNVNNDYSVIARYMYDESTFPFFTVKNPYLKLWEANYNGEKYIFMGVDIYQMEKDTSSITVSSEDISENLFYDINYQGQLAYFNVYYTYNGERELLKTYFNNTYTPPEDEKYCYYTFIDDNKIEISFSALPNNFRPRFNSTLEVEIFTTDGSTANFSFSGEILINYLNDTEMGRIPIYIQPITDASGGADKPSYADIKNKLIEDYLVRDNLITDYDLDLYFNKINSSDKINNSKIKFIKKRNDAIKRLWNSYILLRNNENMVMPTTTIPSLFISNNEMSNNNYIIPENSAVIYDIENDIYFIVWHKLEVEEYLNNPKYLVYAIPYLIKVEKDPVLSSIYYKTHANKDVSLSYNYINPSIPYQFMVSSFDLTRDNMSEDVYKFNLSLVTNLIDDNFDDNVKIRGILKSTNGEIYGYFDFNRTSDTELLYEGYLATEKWNSISNNKLNIYNSLYTLDSSPILDNEGMTTVKNAFIDSDVNLDVVILYKNDFSTEKTTDVLKMPDMTDFGVVCLLRNDDPINLFSNMSNVIESNIFPTESGFKLKSIPLIEYTYFQYNYPLVYDLMDKFILSLTDNMDKLENNTSIDVKFYNTYGKSSWYDTGKVWDSTQNKYVLKGLDRIDLDLNLTIYANNAVTSETDIAIKSYISDFVESCNDEEIFPISNLIRRLEENFDIIRYIEFNSINDKVVQKIESSHSSFLDMTKQEIIDYVPEYLNLRKQLSSNNTDLGVEQYYTHTITINYI